MYAWTTFSWQRQSQTDAAAVYDVYVHMYVCLRQRCLFSIDWLISFVSVWGERTRVCLYVCLNLNVYVCMYIRL